MGLKKEYAALDVAKWVAAILIVSIHAPPLYSVSNIGNFILMQIIARYAVPFFFITSGFLFFSKLSYENIWCSENRCRLFHYVSHLLKLYLIWSAIYLLMLLIGNFNGGGSLFWQLKIIARDFLFAGISPPLWYFTAVIVATCLVFFLLRWLSINVILIGSALIYLLGLLGDSYSFLIIGLPSLSQVLQAYDRIFVSTNNGFFFGLLFVAAGAFISQKKTLFKTCSCWLLFAACSVCFVIEALSVYFLASNFDSKSIYINRWIFLAPAVVSLFMALLQTHVKPTGKTRLMRSMSLVVYLIHPMIIAVLGYFLPNMGFQDIQHNSLLYFALALPISLVLSWMISNFEKRSHFMKEIFG